MACKILFMTAMQNTYFLDCESTKLNYFYHVWSSIAPRPHRYPRPGDYDVTVHVTYLKRCTSLRERAVTSHFWAQRSTPKIPTDWLISPEPAAETLWKTCLVPPTPSPPPSPFDRRRENKVMTKSSCCGWRTQIQHISVASYTISKLESLLRCQADKWQEVISSVGAFKS